jgi:hypothetical protein
VNLKAAPSAIEISRPLIDTAGHKLTVDLPSEPVMVRPIRLGQACEFAQ